MADALRTIGRDGKTNCGIARLVSPRPPVATVYPTVPGSEMARNAVRRLARATSFSPDDLAELPTIATEAGALLQEAISVEAEQHERVRAARRGE
jgi:hypothetical protein